MDDMGAIGILLGVMLFAFKGLIKPLPLSTNMFLAATFKMLCAITIVYCSYAVVCAAGDWKSI